MYSLGSNTRHIIYNDCIFLNFLPPNYNFATGKIICASIFHLLVLNQWLNKDEMIFLEKREEGNYVECYYQNRVLEKVQP